VFFVIVAFELYWLKEFIQNWAGWARKPDLLNIADKGNLASSLPTIIMDFIHLHGEGIFVDALDDTREHAIQVFVDVIR